MNLSDENLYGAILSRGERVRSFHFLPIRRAGYLFLALPRDRRLAERVLKLYQPQRWKGLMFRGFFQFIFRFGLQRFFRRESIDIGRDSLLVKLEELGFGSDFGFLLGNINSSNRNLIGVIELDKNFYVVKSGRSEGLDILQKEYEMTRQFSDLLDEVPKVESEIYFDGGYGYVCELIEGRSPKAGKDDFKIFDVLKKWLDQGLEKKLGDVGAWSEMLAGLEDQSGEAIRLSKLGERKVLSPISHGDFAPWNVIISKDDEVKVLDWEFGDLEGVPGWDAIHYRVQQLSLVDGLNDLNVYTRCLEWISGEWMNGYLKQAGLDGFGSELFGSYCYFSQHVLSYPRQGLIDLWEKELGDGYAE